MATRLAIRNGNVGIGTTGPLYKLDINGGSTASQVHISSGGADSGLYLTTVSDSSGYQTQGVAFNGTNWIAKATTASIFGSSAGSINLYTDSGLTVGNSYTPTSRFTILNSGYVGIGTTSPQNLLNLKSTDGSSALQFNVSSYPTTYGTRIFTNDCYNGVCGGVDLALEVQSAGTWYRSVSFGHGQDNNHPSIRSSYGAQFAVTSGNVGIGNVNPASFKVQVTGSVGPDTDNSYDLGSTGLRWRDVWCQRNAFNGSDARQKTNIIDTPLGLDFIMHLRPVQYNWKKEDDGKHQGLIAQDLEAVLKEKGIGFAGLRYDKESDTYGLAYTEFIAPLIKAVQEQQGQIEKQQKEIENLRAEIEKLRTGSANKP
jgi:hypothetical protein